MKILQINVAINTGSTGRITEQLGNAALQEGFESYIAFSRSGLKSSSQTIKIGHKFDFYKHVIYSRLFDRHGFASRTSTKNLCKEIEKIKPEIIHLHNIHGYYLHIEVLFTYLSNLKIPIVWTFHDCWPFTGHCAHFDDIGCKKWKSTCYSCPKVRSYPKSWFIDNSKSNKIDDGTVGLRGVFFTKDGSLAAYMITEGGSDWRKVIAIDTETKGLHNQDATEQ